MEEERKRVQEGQRKEKTGGGMVEGRGRGVWEMQI